MDSKRGKEEETHSGFKFLKSYSPEQGQLSLTREILTDDDVVDICNFIKNTPKIRELSFHKCNINSHQLSTLFDFLKKETSISSIAINGSKLDSNSIKHLSEFLKQNKNIAAVSLQYAELENEYLKPIVEALKGNTNLKFLNLANNKIDVEGAKLLAKLADISKLEKLVVNNEKLESQFLLALSNLIENKSDSSFQNEEMIIVMQALGYQADLEGVCFGYSTMQMQAFLAKDLETFNKRLNFIAYLFAEAQSEIIKEKNIPAINLSKEEKKHFDKMVSERVKENFDKLPGEKKSDILAFFDGVMIQQMPFKYSNLLDRSIFSLLGQNQVNAFPLTLSKELENDVAEVTHFVGAYDYKNKERDKFFEILGEKLEKMQLSHPVSFILSSTDHTIHVGYDPKSDKPWMFSDVKSAQFKRGEESKLAHKVHTADSFSKDGHAVFSTQVFCRKGDQEKINQVFKELKSDDEWKKIHRTTFKKLKLTLFNNFLALKHRHSEKFIGYAALSVGLLLGGMIATPFLPPLGIALVALGTAVGIAGPIAIAAYDKAKNSSSMSTMPENTTENKKEKNAKIEPSTQNTHFIMKATQSNPAIAKIIEQKEPQNEPHFNQQNRVTLMSTTVEMTWSDIIKNDPYLSMKNLEQIESDLRDKPSGTYAVSYSDPSASFILSMTINNKVSHITCTEEQYAQCKSVQAIGEQFLKINSHYTNLQLQNLEDSYSNKKTM